MKLNRSSHYRRAFFLSILASFTLGLAPFLPEPHLIGKWRWVFGGAIGMKPMDWFDLVLHTSPFLIMILFGSLWLGSRQSTTSTKRN